MAVPESSRQSDFGVLVIVCFFIVSSAGTATAKATTPQIEVHALNAILAKLNATAEGPWTGENTNLPWYIDGDPCSGVAINDTIEIEDDRLNPGIKCDCTYNSNKTCHIIKLKAWYMQPQSTVTIPDELQNLTYLEYLDLEENNLTGHIPAFMGNFTRMKYLNLPRNYLTGSVPAIMGNLTRMQYLLLGFNVLSGPVPWELGNLKNLTCLQMGPNNFSGSIPNEFGNLMNLQELYIDSSGLSGELPSTLSNLINMQIMWASDNAFIGKIPYYIGTWTGLLDLRFEGNSFQGSIPSSFLNLVNLTNLRIGDITDNTSSTLAFISNMISLSTLILRNCKISDTLPTNFSNFKSLQLLDLSFNNITGEVPQSLFNLISLKYLFLGNNSLNGSLPSQKSSSLMNIDLSYNLLSGSFPSWISQNDNLQLNLVANNFNLQNSKSSVSSSGLECLQRDFSCYKESPIYSSFAINCGSESDFKTPDGTLYQSDNADLSAIPYYVTGAKQWGISIISTSNDSKIYTMLDDKLFDTARNSSSSLRYYGFGLKNGNYIVKLQFAEIKQQDTPDWTNTARRVFDIFIQGALEEKDFDIKKNYGGKSFAEVMRNYTVPVTNNYIEIHFFWAGKGTCCIPLEDSYGPIISAISVKALDFTPAPTPMTVPTVSNTKPNSSKRKRGLIVGVLVGLAVLGLLTILAVIYWRHKKKMSEIDEEFLGIVDRPDVFSYAELRIATEAFSTNNILGEGGYGPVYKGKLSDGRIVAIKQLGATSHQGKREFLTEISTISAVQHKNLVKLYGCCIEGNHRLLVYEFLENGSLDQVLYGKRILYLDWVTRFEICLGVAKGLAYLHEESSVRIIHRDIKAGNILLDSDLSPKISDFGLAKFYENSKTHMSTGVAGTLGYLAPEYAMRGHLSEKTDIFAFGVVALEIIAGRSKFDPTLEQDQMYLLEWAWSLYEQNHTIGLLDSKLTSYDEDQALRLISISLLCTQASQQRPSMSRVVAMLTGDMEVNKATSKPSYLTETTTQTSDLRACISHPNSSDVLMDSIIQDGR